MTVCSSIGTAASSDGSIIQRTVNATYPLIKCLRAAQLHNTAQSLGELPAGH